MKLMISIAMITLTIFCFRQAAAQTSAKSSAISGEETEMFVHPFLAHMGLPDAPNEVSVRLTGIKTRLEGGDTQSDFSFHIEAGLVKNLGIHLRSDGINHEEYSEVMLQYALLKDSEMKNGISIFGQVSIPTGTVKTNTYKGLFGGSYTLTAGDIAVLNGNVHYDPKDKMAEYEDAFVFRRNELIFPIFEIRGHITSDYVSAYLLPGIKFRASKNYAFGVGVQAAVSDTREYDEQALFTLEGVF